MGRTFLNGLMLTKKSLSLGESKVSEHRYVSTTTESDSSLFSLLLLFWQHFMVYEFNSSSQFQRIIRRYVIFPFCVIFIAATKFVTHESFRRICLQICNACALLRTTVFQKILQHLHQTWQNGRVRSGSGWIY